MIGFKYYGSYKKLQYESSYINKEDSPCHGIKNISIIVHKRKKNERKTYPLKIQSSTYPDAIFHVPKFGSSSNRNYITRYASMPEINHSNKCKKTKLKTKSYYPISQIINIPCGRKYLKSEQSLKYTLKSFFNNNKQSNFEVYRCQLSTNIAENCENCCCSCNSDTMFEVMKDLYECYKKKNCDNCNCILCCHSTPMEKRLKKSSQPCAEVNLENALKEVAMKGFALPEGKTPSEKELIDTIRNVLGLPPEPMSQDMRDKYTNAANARLMLPLEGKTPKQKEKILRDLHSFGIPLPIGRTPSEKSLINKILKKVPQHSDTLTDKMQEAKRSGLLSTNFEGKTPEQIENILRELAMRGIPLPEGQTPSVKNLIEKVRTNLGLPPEPRNSIMKEMHKKAAEVGLLLPLEGKTPDEKEMIIQGLNNMNIPLPKGRTPSEIALIAKVKERRKLEEKTALNMKEGTGPVDECICEFIAPHQLGLLDKKRKAKVAGLLTPLNGKSKEQKEKILKGLALEGFSLPKGQTVSEAKLIRKVRADLGLPPEPKTSTMRDTYIKAANDGILVPLEGKSTKEKEKILRALFNRGIPLPKGRTSSEKALIERISKEPHTPSKEKTKKQTTFIKGKTPEQQEKILRDRAMKGLPLPEGKTDSDKKLLAKVREELGLPPEPKTPSMRIKYDKAAAMGLMLPLKGKSLKEKETVLRNLANIGIPLPKGRTLSERALIARIKGEPRDSSLLRLKLEPEPPIKHKRKVIPLFHEGKTPEEKEKILRDMAFEGILLPKGETPSEMKLIRKVRIELGLPPEPKSSAARSNYIKAAEKGILVPLEGHSPEEKERILRGLIDFGIALPQPRTPSEKSIIIRIHVEHKTPSEKMRKARDEGLLTSLSGKPASQQERILREQAMMGIPLPKGNTASQNIIIKKIRIDLGLPPEPKTSSMRNRYVHAIDIGVLQPLEGKTPKQKEKILRELIELKIPLPKGRTLSEQLLIDRVQKEKSAHSTVSLTEKMRGAKAAGLLTPLQGKSPAQKEKILRGLAMNGIPLPEGKTESEKNIINKVRIDLGLPPEPKTSSIRDKYIKAAEAGILLPLENKTPKEKEKILRRLADAGIPLPKARTHSEKALIDKIKGEPRALTRGTLSEKMRKAYEAGLYTPLTDKTPAQIEKILQGRANLGIPLPEGKSSSIRNITNKVRHELGLPPQPKTQAMREKHEKAAAAGLLVPLEGKSQQEKKKILEGLTDMGIPLPKGRTDSEKNLIAEVKERAKLELKSSKEPEPSITTEKLREAKAAGLLTPLDKKSKKEKESILRNLAKVGLPLPEGKTRSEKALINQIKKEYGIGKETSAEKIRRAKAAGYLTPLDGKTLEQKEKILRGRVAAGLPLPKGKTPSEKDLINKIKASTGYVTPSPSEMLQKAKTAGLLSPLHGKTPSEKFKQLKHMAAAGVPLPEGSTPSEKELIKKLNAIEKSKLGKIRVPKDAGMLTPLTGKTPEQKEKILRKLAKSGFLFPEPRTPSEKVFMDKLRHDMGLPPSPKTSHMREKYKKAHAAGIITPLEGKTLSEKENILKKLNEAGIPLPAGRTPSEKLQIKRVKAGLSEPRTPFEEMTPSKKEKKLRGLIKSGGSLPDGKTPSGKVLINKVRKDMGLPPEPKTISMKEKMRKARSAGLITPLEGKTSIEKENILRDLAEAGIPLPEGRTASEKAIKRKIEAEVKKKLDKRSISKKFKKPEGPSEAVVAAKIKKAKEEGIETSIEGKSPEEKEKIVRELVKLGLPLPEGTSPSDKQLIKNIRKSLGLPPSPETSSMKKRHIKAAAKGLLIPLEGLTQAEKEELLKSQAKIGLPLPEGRTSSEKSLIHKIKEDVALSKIPLAKLQKAEDAGLLTPLKGKSQAEKEKIVRGRIKAGLPPPEGRTTSEKALIKKIRAEYDTATAPTSSGEKLVAKAKEAGLITPLTGKTSAEKEKILQGLAEAGLPLPEGSTSKERDLIRKIKDQYKTTSEKGSATDILLDRIITKCERACGCDKKKIRFKHSYVKIRVTSPDISSLCPCPDECVPGVKGGVFVDNDGIKVIIERATDMRQNINFRNIIADNLTQDDRNSKKFNYLLDPVPMHFGIKDKNCSNLLKSMYEHHNLNCSPVSDSQHCMVNGPFTYFSFPDERSHVIRQSRHELMTNKPLNEKYSIEEDSDTFIVTRSSSGDSFDSVIIIKSETSINFSSSYEDANSSSAVSFPTSDFTSMSYLLPFSNVDFTNSITVRPEFLANGVKYCTIDSKTRYLNPFFSNLVIITVDNSQRPPVSLF